VTPIKGIGPSTYTKFLSFLSVQVQGHAALILDDRIIRVANEGIFEELRPLKNLSHKKMLTFPTQITCGAYTISQVSFQFHQNK